MYMQSAYTLADIHPALGALERRARRVANAAQGIAILAIAGADAALNLWQSWSDRTFGTVQPEVLKALEAIAYLLGWAAAMACGFCALACDRTWQLWMEAAPHRATLDTLLSPDWQRIRAAFAVAYSAAAIAVVGALLVSAYVLTHAPRWAGRVVAFALCVE